MVVQTELSEAEVDRVFHALATSVRRDILRRTIEREQSVSTLASEYEMSFAAVQKHVAVLEAANLIIKRAEGREWSSCSHAIWGALVVRSGFSVRNVGNAVR